MSKSEKKVVFTFGRFQGITHGHAKLINKTIEHAKQIGAEHRIYTSQSHDSNKNPIPYERKIGHLRAIFPKANVVHDTEAKTAFHVAKKLSDEGYDHVTMVVGQDREEEFRQSIGKYVKDRSHPDFDPKKHYGFKSFKVISAGARDENASGVEGESGTKLRQRVRDNDFAGFAKSVPTKNVKIARAMFQDMRANLQESVELNEEEGIDHKKFGPMLDSFTKFASEKLGIKSMPNIEMSKDGMDSSFGGYSPATKSIVVVTKNRHPMDVFRTVAHELVHHKQNEEGRIKDVAREGSTGSDIENEANADAGKLMRWYAKHNPDAFKWNAVNESINLEEGLNDPGKMKAVFMAGGPGSGKDFVMNRVLGGHGLTEINSDNALEHLMKKRGLDLKMPDSETEERDKVRGVAKNMTKEKERLAIAGRRGLIINGTADDPEKIARIKKELEKNGYETKMLFVNTSNEVSRQRNVMRGMGGGRKVPDGTNDQGVPDGSKDIRSEKWIAAQEAKEKLRKLFGDQHFMHVDNSDDYRKVDDKRKKEIDQEHQKLFKHYRQFVSTPAATEKSKQWVDAEKKKRGVTDYRPARATKVSQRPSKPLPYQPNASELEQAKRLGVQHLGNGTFGQQKDAPSHVTKNGQLQVAESLRDWFQNSRAKDGTKGWVQVGGKFAGEPCARQPGQTTTPKCRSSSEASRMTKKEKQYAFKKKNREDPNQPEKSGAAKPTMVKTYKDQVDEEKDACYSKVKARYKVWPSAYASGALVRCRKVGAANWGNKSKMDENFENFVAENTPSDREWGKTSLTNIYKNDTPGQGKKKKKVTEAQPPLGYEFGNNGVGPTFGVVRSPGGLGYGYSIPMSESIQQWMNDERTINTYTERYGDLAEKKIREAAERLNEMKITEKKGKYLSQLREAWEAKAGRDMGTVPNTGKEEIEEKKLTDAELSAREKQVKKLKKHKKGFVDRYGKDAESVMYAVATKQAKTMAESSKEDVVKPSKTVKGYKKLVHPMSDFEKKANETMNEDWQKVNRNDKTDGLSQKAVNAYRRENPGSKLQTAVTEKNPKGKRAKRRLSFCRRMKGMKAKLTSAETSRDPDSRINKALRRWNCEE